MAQFWAMGIVLGLFDIPRMFLLYMSFGGDIRFGHHKPHKNNFGDRWHILAACHSHFNVTRPMAEHPLQAYISVSHQIHCIPSNFNTAFIKKQSSSCSNFYHCVHCDFTIHLQHHSHVSGIPNSWQTIWDKIWYNSWKTCDGLVYKQTALLHTQTTVYCTGWPMLTVMLSQ